MEWYLDWVAYLISLPWMFIVFLLIPIRTPKVAIIRTVLAITNAVYGIVLPLYILTPYPLVNLAIRLPAGYLAMKVLDLAIMRRHDPPVLKDQGKLPTTFLGQLRYAILLTQQTRYESFNIATVQPRKSTTPWTYHLYQYATVILLNIFLPIAEVRVLAVLLAIYTSFEIGHTILRPGSGTPLFNAPFYCPTLGSFWSKGWHSIILSPLMTLAYKPAERFGGRSAGVLAAFALSGIWHGYAAVAVGGYIVAWRIVVVFIMQACGIMAEQVLWGRQRTLLRRICIWAWSLGWSGWALRSFEQRGDYWLPCW
jgi:hypothetical protein